MRFGRWYSERVDSTRKSALHIQNLRAGRDLMSHACFALRNTTGNLPTPAMYCAGHFQAILLGFTGSLGPLFMGLR